MGTYNRPNKAGGGTGYTSGQVILSNEVDADLDIIQTTINGNLDDANIAAAAAILPSKIDDHSTNTAIQADDQTPGISGAQSAGTLANLTDEIETIRYKIRQMGLGLSAKLESSVTSAKWFDDPARPGNLIKNGSFAQLGATTALPPTYWSLENTPTLNDVADPAFGSGNVLEIVAGAVETDEGISQTLVGLRPGVRYLVGCLCEVVTGTATLRTVGGETSGSFENLEVESTDTNLHVLAGLVQTQDPIANLEVHILAAGSSNRIRVSHFFVYETGDDHVGSTPTNEIFQSATTGAGAAASFEQTGLTTLQDVSGGSDLTVVVTVPAAGYQIEAEAKVVVEAAGPDEELELQLQRNTVLQDASSCHFDAAGDQATVVLGELFTAAAAGTTYTWRVQGRTKTGNVQSSPTTAFASTAQTVSWIRVRMIAP
jgi:hypothetical protein